jgi:hypothetical protein
MSKSRRLPSKGRDLTEKQKIAIAEEVCKYYKTDQYTLTSCLKKAGIKSTATWYDWLKIDKIKKLYSEAQQFKERIYRASLQERARNSLEKMVEGYVIETQEIEEILPDGQDGVTIVTKRKRKQQYIRPSPTLILAALNNTDNFKKNNDSSFNDDTGLLPTDIKIEIIGADLPPVTSEDDINENI